MIKEEEEHYTKEDLELDLQKDLTELEKLTDNCDKDAVLKMQALRGQLLVSRYKYGVIGQDRFDEYRSQLDKIVLKFTKECVCHKMRK